MIEVSPNHVDELKVTKQKFGNNIVDYETAELTAVDDYYG